MMKRVASILLAFVLLALGSDAAAQETPRMGGVLKVATIGEPPSLDIPMATAVITYEIMWHVNETLFTYDAAFNPVPLLADTHAVTDGGRRHTITLRKGVTCCRSCPATA
jgi:peptide/nickel transport system substrate-binding protein